MHVDFTLFQKVVAMSSGHLPPLSSLGSDLPQGGGHAVNFRNDLKANQLEVKLSKRLCTPSTQRPSYHSMAYYENVAFHLLSSVFWTIERESVNLVFCSMLGKFLQINIFFILLLFSCTQKPRWHYMYCTDFSSISPDQYLSLCRVMSHFSTYMYRMFFCCMH